MIALGLRLSLRGGGEAVARLALIVAGVAAGVTVLLVTLSLFNAFQATSARPCWECTTGTAPSGWALDATADGALWNYRLDYYAGQSIKRLDAAALGPRAPVVPGLARMPAPGQYYASPALARLLASVPPEQLGDRFPGTLAGTVGRAALSGPDELTVVVGRTPLEVAAITGTRQVDTVETGTGYDDFGDLYRFGFAVAAIGLFVPLLVLVGTATRLAAARREARFAAIRLVGATSRQISVIAAMDAAIGAFLGALLGLALFPLVRPAVADLRITGARFYPDLVTPEPWQYAAVLVGVPLLAGGTALWSLRRVRVSPLGTVRKAAPRPPRIWRVIPLLAGLGLFAGPVFRDEGHKADEGLAAVALALVMVGLVLAGPWVTMLAARLAARVTGGAATLLASQRLAADPRGAFRSVSGLVLAVFLGTAIAGIVPAVVSGQQAVAGGALTGVLRAPLGLGGLPPREGAELLDRLRSYPGVGVLPVYALAEPAENHLISPDGPPPRTAVGCAELARLPVIGTCPAGARAVMGNFERLVGADNPLTVDRILPLAGPSSRPATTTGLSLAAVLVRLDATNGADASGTGTGDVEPGGERTGADGAATLERVRTLLARYGADAPMTFAEVAQTRATLFTQIENIALGIVALTLLTGGCSLVVAVGGGLMERRQPFTLLRLAGTPARTLASVVLLESALPLVLAAAVAAAAGFGVAGPMIDGLAMKNASPAMPGPVYFATVGAGLAASLLVILMALPLLRHMTAPDNARFE
ncbi:FtsX-like permease family protein [Nonomuraea fuscirosea]|uniref:FtsX-like permease family protein n=1 Tax=Nonomuraea fuscirosea TaxID=1291556 RepID=A0A2T0N3I9_9ACTN|nr:FtsX-like permease family protein [Nonomuraea fuscirosea]PRX66722.1 FtsX-like permease family protein [Nonomuraea fuscirosea]